MDENTVTAQTETAPSAEGAVNPPTDATVTAEEKKPEKPPEGYVPHQALHAERIKARRLERDLAEVKLKLTTADERIAKLAEAWKPPQQAPNEQEDPVGAIVHETRQTRQEIEAFKKQQEEERRIRAAQNAQAQLVQYWQSQAQAFAAKQPDFPQSYQHLFENFVSELQEAGYDEQQASVVAQNYWADIVGRARMDGVNPAERMYNLAKRRGYKPATEKIETIKKGTEATSPLASAGGKPPSNLTAEAIANLPMDEFEKLLKKDPDAFRKAFGG